MRKIISLFSLLMVCVLSAQAGQYYKVTTFQDGYNTHEVGVTITDDSWFLLIDFDSKSDDQITLIYSPSQVEPLRTFFKNVKEKYLEWVGVARRNNVKSITKRMDFFAPTAVAMWADGGDIHYTEDDVVINPLFSNSNDDGTKFKVFNAISIADKDDPSVTNTVHINFDNAMQIQNLINAINPTVLQNKVNTERRNNAPQQSSRNVDDLFK